MDADLGLANVNVVLGVIPRYNLYHLIRKQKTLSEILVDTSYGIQIIAGASGFSKIANLNEDERRDFIAELAALSNADVLIIDCAAGVSNNVISFIAAADDALIVTTPEPTAITDAYGIIKIIATEIENLDLGLKLDRQQGEVGRGGQAGRREGDQHRRAVPQSQGGLPWVRLRRPRCAHLGCAAEAVSHPGAEVPRRPVHPAPRRQAGELRVPGREGDSRLPEKAFRVATTNVDSARRMPYCYPGGMGPVKDFVRDVWKIAAACACGAFFLSLVIGLFAGNPFGVVLLPGAPSRRSFRGPWRRPAVRRQGVPSRVDRLILLAGRSREGRR